VTATELPIPAQLNRSRSYAELIAFLALSQAMAAMAIDTILPAFPEIRAHLALPADSPRVSLLITAFFFGNGAAQLFTGILADRFGRRRVMWAGLCIYILGALGATFSPTLGVMIVFRVLWGIGASAPRVVGVAMVRDQFEGSRMSYVQGVFVIVPVLAPSLGAQILHFGGWRWAMVTPAILAVGLCAWLVRMPETLPPERRRIISVRTVFKSFGEIIRIPRTLLLIGVMTCCLATVTSYISVAELITDQTYGMKSSFALVFGTIALAMGAAGFMNANLVGRFGVPRVLNIAPVVAAGVAVSFLTGTLINDGRPPYIFYCVSMAGLLAALPFVVTNSNSLALQPLGHIAGVASGVIGTVSTILSALLGIVVAQSHGSGTTALAIGIAIFSVTSLLLSRVALRSC
jgi:MFS transporter, DHA1 family, multidrug resistance protein